MATIVNAQMQNINATTQTVRGESDSSSSDEGKDEEVIFTQSKIP